MIYRETGQFKANYQDDQALFPIDQDRYVIFGVLFVTFAVVPYLLNQYWLNAILLPFLIYSLAALGSEYSDRLLRPAVARYRRLHGGGRVFGLQADGRLSRARFHSAGD